MDRYAKIRDLLAGFHRSGQVFFPATVESVEGATCTVNVDNLPIPNVRLRPTTAKTENEILLIPEIGSSVLVGSHTGDLSNLFVLQSDSISEAYLKVDEISFKLDKNGIEINEGNNKGLVKIESMVSWMQKVYADLQTLKTLLSTSPGKPSGVPLAIVFNPSAPNPVLSDFEDKKVTH